MSSLWVYNIPIREADADPEKAAKVLLEAARLLKSGESLPYELAIYLADAFELAMSKLPEERGIALARELNLAALNRRRKNIDPEWLLRPEYLRLSETQAKKKIANEYGISESSALKAFKEAKEMDRQESNDRLS
jgi:hypothetical protein